MIPSTFRRRRAQHADEALGPAPGEVCAARPLGLWERRTATYSVSTRADSARYFRNQRFTLSAFGDAQVVALPLTNFQPLRAWSMIRFLSQLPFLSTRTK